MRLNSFRSFSRKASLAVALMGCTVIWGWIFNIAFLKSVWPGLVTMKANTAVGLILAGVSLWLWHRHPPAPGKRRAVQTCAVLVLLIGLFTLIEYGFNLDIGIDQLLFRVAVVGVGDTAPGRMAVHTAVTFVLLGSALLLLNQTRPNYLLAQIHASMAFLIGFVGLWGYIYGNAYFYRLGSLTSIAVHTASAFLLLSLGILFACPDKGLMVVITSSNAGGVMARRLFPAAIAIPPVVCWLILLGYRKQVYTAEMGLCLVSVLNVVIFAVLIWWNARELGAIDKQRSGAETALQQTLETLEMRVVERTEGLTKANRALQAEIEERLRVESALKESEERFRRAVLDAPLPLAIHAEDGEILQISKTWTKLSGYGHHDIPTIADWTEKAYGLRSESVQADIERLYSLDTRVAEGEYVITTLSGETRIWDFSSAPLGQLVDGRRLAMSMALDVTERKRTEEQSQASLKEKEVLLKEIHHRVKNNLQIISSLLNLQADHLQDERVLEIFKDSQSRIESMALIHEQLYQSRDLAQINFANYIEELLANLFSTYGCNSEAITRKLVIADIFLNLDAAIPCSLIINELVANSLKYAFPAGTGEIYIDFALKQDIFTLLISDNGIGLPPDFDFENTPSLGFKLVKALASQLQGTIKIDTNGGVKCELTFPLEQ